MCATNVHKSHLPCCVCVATKKQRLVLRLHTGFLGSLPSSCDDVMAYEVPAHETPPAAPCCPGVARWNQQQKALIFLFSEPRMNEFRVERLIAPNTKCRQCECTVHPNYVGNPHTCCAITCLVSCVYCTIVALLHCRWYKCQVALQQKGHCVSGD